MDILEGPQLVVVECLQLHLNVDMDLQDLADLLVEDVEDEGEAFLAHAVVEGHVEGNEGRDRVPYVGVQDVVFLESNWQVSSKD